MQYILFHGIRKKELGATIDDLGQPFLAQEARILGSPSTSWIFERRMQAQLEFFFICQYAASRYRNDYENPMKALVNAGNRSQPCETRKSR